MLQQVVLLAGACAQVQHIPASNVQHQPSANVAVMSSVSSHNLNVELPITIDLLRGKQAGRRPLLGEAPMAKAAVKGNDVTLTLLGQPPIDLTAACTPVGAPGRR
jgi:hypothetical protein